MARIAAPARDLAIDRFRGLAIVMMAIANFMEHVHAVPAWLKHAPDVGLTVIDFIAPAFIFAIGLTFGGSTRRRLERDGGRRTVEHVLGRAFALIGLGMMFSVGEWKFGLGGGTIPWGTLQSIGAAILVALPALFLPWPGRLALAAGGLVAWQWLLDSFWLAEVVATDNAGLQGSLSWGMLLVIATAFGDLHAARRPRPFAAAALLAAGIAASFLVPVSKHRMSLSFVLIVAGSASLAFAAFDATRDWMKGEGRLLSAWGRNPLLLYVAHLFLLAVFLVPDLPWWHVEATLWLTTVQGVAFLGVLHALAAWLRRRNLIVSL